jgi:hypothetical protein
MAKTREHVSIWPSSTGPDILHTGEYYPPNGWCAKIISCLHCQKLVLIQLNPKNRIATFFHCPYCHNVIDNQNPRDESIFCS